MDLATYSHMSWDNQSQPRQVALLRVCVMFPAIIVILTMAALRSRDVVAAPLYVGVSCMVLASVLSITGAFNRFDQPTMLAVGALDLAGVLVIGSLPGAAAAGALVAVPGLWLGGVFRWRGVGLAAVMGVTAIAGSELLQRSGHLQTGTERTTWFVTFGVVAAVAMASTVHVWVGQVVLLEAQRADLADALSQLEEQQQYIETIVRTVDVGLASLGADGSYSSLNPRHLELMGLAFPDGHSGRAGEIGDVFGADNETRIDPDQLPSVRAMEGETFTDTLWIGGDAATRLAIAVSATPIPHPDGTFTGAVIAYHDITTRMRALRVKDDFVAMVSHELRTPLTSIIGSLELAADLAGDTDELVHLLAVANRNADRMLHLVGDLLTVSLHVDPNVQMEHESLDMSDLVRQSVRDVVAQAERGNVELITRIEPGLRLMGARGRLLQVTDNLLSNALKYTPPEGRVSVELRQDRGDTLLTVQDTGIGVGTADQDEVFSKFFRGRNATDLGLPGVGLGLAISKAIVEAHGGSISLASREGEGTTMVVTLPSPGPGQ
jgi:two-component system phosphate regulon sensor histidine kinase PhoR